MTRKQNPCHLKADYISDSTLCWIKDNMKEILQSLCWIKDNMKEILQRPRKFQEMISMLDNEQKEAVDIAEQSVSENQEPDRDESRD